MLQLKIKPRRSSPVEVKGEGEVTGGLGFDSEWTPNIPRIRSAPPLPENEKVGGRLAKFWRRWQKIDASPWVINTLKNGVSLQFIDNILPPLSSSPIFMDSYQQNPEKRQALFLAVEELVHKGVLEEVSNPNTPGYYGRLFIRPKPNGKWRTIIDLSGLNNYVQNETFRMETPKSIQNQMRQGMHATSIDLTDAYYHLLMAENHRDYLRVALFGKVFRFRAMPMGLNISARVFTKVTSDFMKFLRKKKIHIHAYIDDWFSVNYRGILLNSQTSRTVVISTWLGWLINLPKSELKAGQIRKFVGIQFDFVRGLAIVPLERVLALEKMIKVIKAQKGCSARVWSRLIGKMGSMAGQISLGALHRRPVQRFLQMNWNQKQQKWDRFVKLQKWLIPHLNWWMKRQNTMAGVPLKPFKPDVTIFTDASKWGFGATMGNQEISGMWSNQESKLHSNNREMLATIKTIKHFKELIRNKEVLLCSDNTSTIAAINKQGGTKSWSLTRMAWKMWNEIDSLNCSIRARHVPGKLNVRADAMSRLNQILPTEWSIKVEALIPIWALWGQPTVDLFATCHNYKLPTYVSPIPDSQAWQVDALSVSWENVYAYVFPPWSILTDVISKIADDEAEVILIAPKWERRSWFPLLLDLLIAPPVPLPMWSDLLIQTHSGQLCNHLQLLNLHAWRLSGKALRN